MSIIICYVKFSVCWTWDFLQHFEPFRLLRLATCAHFVTQFLPSFSMEYCSFCVRLSWLFFRYISVLFIKFLIFSGLFLDIFSYFFLINSLQESIKVYNESDLVFFGVFWCWFWPFVVLGYLSGRDLFSLMICLSHSIFLKS